MCLICGRLYPGCTLSIHFGGSRPLTWGVDKTISFLNLDCFYSAFVYFILHLSKNGHESPIPKVN